MFDHIEPTPEREKIVIKEAANFIVDNDLTGVAEPFLKSLQPTSDILGGIAFIQFFHWSVLLGRWAMELTYMLADKPRETIDRILTEMEELETEKKLRGKTEKRSPNLFSFSWWRVLLGK